MEDIVSFKKKINSYIKRSEDGNVCLTSFLDEAEISLTLECLKSHPSISYKYYGKINNADRVRFIFSPYEIDDEDFKIKIYQIIYNKTIMKLIIVLV